MSWQVSKTDSQVNMKIARMHQKLANAEVTIRELHKLIDEFQAWLREAMEEKIEGNRGV